MSAVLAPKPSASALRPPTRASPSSEILPALVVIVM